jgi:phosphoribosylformimino-5-aminoimidazole carboxamide ribotide isomerase
MILYPAIDLLEGAAVQLVGGRPDDVRVRVDDVAGLAAGFSAAGFRALHVVDLDGALGRGTNRELIERLAAGPLPVQVGGGLRTTADVDAVLELGAARVLVGTRGLLDPDWLGALAERHPGRIVVAADTDGAQLLVRGWTEPAPIGLAELFAATADRPLAGYLVTDVAREGRMTGARVDLFSRLVSAAPHPVMAAGGIASVDDLRQLERAGVAGVVLGMSLYTGRLGASQLEEFLT